jgi:DNA primase
MGREYYACPAHPDKHPSGVIYVEDQQYHCYQCGAHGDVFDCLMAFKGMTFMQAVDAVAGYLGVELPKPKAKTTGKGCVAL